MIDAYAKVNLRLKVTNKRPDNYHNLEMINISIDLADHISIKKDKSGDIIINTNNSILPTDEANIIYKICLYFKKTFLINDGLDIYIDKRIPLGAGLGGGSSDGAALIRWYNEEYKLELSDDDLIGLAVKFGADVPYCLFSRPALVTGIGENIKFINIKLPPYLLLITPPLQVSTKEIFEEYDKLNIINEKRSIIGDEINDNILDLMENDLAKVTMSKYPQLLEYKNTLETFGTNKIMMSGSGPSLFCLVDSINLGNTILTHYQTMYPTHFSILTRIIMNTNY